MVAHIRTGKEILRQTGYRLDAFVAGAGTGGTLAGVSHALHTAAPASTSHDRNDRNDTDDTDDTDDDEDDDVEHNGDLDGAPPRCLAVVPRVYLVDPPGSSLYHKVKRGVLYSKVEAEGTRLRNPFDTIVEGVGLNRLTWNFKQARIDDAVKCTDQVRRLTYNVGG